MLGDQGRRSRPGPRVGRRRSTTQDHITDVALDLFASRGFDEVSVDDVANAAGIAIMAIIAETIFSPFIFVSCVIVLRNRVGGASEQ